MVLLIVNFVIIVMVLVYGGMGDRPSLNKVLGNASVSPPAVPQFNLGQNANN